MFRLDFKNVGKYYLSDIIGNCKILCFVLFCIRFARNEQYTTGSYGSTIYSMLESLYLIEVAAKKKKSQSVVKKNFWDFQVPST